MEFHYSLANVLVLAIIVPFVPRTVTGIAAACVAATILSAAWFIGRAHAEMGVPLRRYAVEVLLPGLAPYAAGMVLLQLAPAVTGRWESLFALAVIGPVFAVLSAAGLFAFCASDAERQAVRQLANRLPFLGLPAEVGQPGL